MTFSNILLPLISLSFLCTISSLFLQRERTPQPSLFKLLNPIRFPILLILFAVCFALGFIFAWQVSGVFLISAVLVLVTAYAWMRVDHPTTQALFLFTFMMVASYVIGRGIPSITPIFTIILGLPFVISLLLWPWPTTHFALTQAQDEDTAEITTDVPHHPLNQAPDLAHMLPTALSPSFTLALYLSIGTLLTLSYLFTKQSPSEPYALLIGVSAIFLVTFLFRRLVSPRITSSRMKYVTTSIWTLVVIGLSSLLTSPLFTHSWTLLNTFEQPYRLPLAFLAGVFASLILSLPRPLLTKLWSRVPAIIQNLIQLAIIGLILWLGYYLSGLIGMMFASLGALAYLLFATLQEETNIPLTTAWVWTVVLVLIVFYDQLMLHGAFHAPNTDWLFLAGLVVAPLLLHIIYSLMTYARKIMWTVAREEASLQFKERKGLAQGKIKPDTLRVVTRSLRKAGAPLWIASVIIPAAVVGAYFIDAPLFVGLLLGITVTSITKSFLEQTDEQNFTVPLLSLQLALISWIAFGILLMNR